MAELRKKFEGNSGLSSQLCAANVGNLLIKLRKASAITWPNGGLSSKSCWDPEGPTGILLFSLYLSVFFCSVSPCFFGF